MTGRKLLGLIGSLALTAALIVGVIWAARSSGSGGEGAAVAPLVTQTPTSVTTPALATFAPTSTASPSASPTPLPEPDAGYTWYVTPPNDYGLPRYAVQLPDGWSLPGPFYGKFLSAPESATYEGPSVAIGVSETAFLEKVRTPHLFYWDLPHQGGDCQEIVEAGQEVIGAYAWDIYTFACRTRDPDNPAGYVTIAGLAAEVRVGEFVFSILAKQPPGSTAADAAFHQAMDSLTLQ